MVKQGLTHKDREQLVCKLKELGFRVYDITRKRKIGLVFKACKLMVIVWIPSEQETEQESKGWVLITDERGEKALYFFPPVCPPKNFIKNLLELARIARCLVEKRPRCPICDSFMKIVFCRGAISRCWVCPRGHKQYVLHYGLPKWAKDFFKRLRKKQKDGKSTRVAVKIRRRWRKK